MRPIRSGTSICVGLGLLVALGLGAAQARAEVPTDRPTWQVAQAAPEVARDRPGEVGVGTPPPRHPIAALLSWLVSGLVIGALAKLLMPGPDGGGIVMTSLLGIAGALLGGLVAGALGIGSFAGFSLGGVVIAVLGAMALLLVQRRFRGHPA